MSNEQEILNAVFDSTNQVLKTSLAAGDIAIGQVELKDSDSTAQANIKVANTARTTGTVVLATQPIDAAGNVLGKTAANTARTTGTLVTPVQQVAADGTVDKLTTLTTLIGGGVAANAADSGNPVKVGGKYNATAPTLDGGDRGDLELDVNGNLQVNQRTLQAGEDQTNDVMKVEGQFSYNNVTASGVTVVKGTAGFVHSVTLNNPVASGVFVLYDASGVGAGIVATITNPDTLLDQGPRTALYDVKCPTGISASNTIAQNVTVSYR